MEILFLMVILIIIITVLLFKIVLQIQLQYDSSETNFHLTLLWLDPLIKVFVTIENSKILLHLYLLKKPVLKRSLKRDNQKKLGFKYLQLFCPKDVYVHIVYGCSDPFITGIAFGVIELATEFVNIDYLDQKPNFLADNDYVYVDATANVNLGSTLLKMIK